MWDNLHFLWICLDTHSSWLRVGKDCGVSGEKVNTNLNSTPAVTPINMLTLIGNAPVSEVNLQTASVVAPATVGVCRNTFCHDDRFTHRLTK